MKYIRNPIVSVLGHVDHGKSSLLDAIRESDIVSTEAGGITQAIGASIIPLEIIEKKCKGLLSKTKIKFTLPGLLFIDTPGHAAFTTLRKRGGSIADIAIVVIDINEGFRPQTIEAIEILKSYKTPFVIAANKLDLVQNYKKKNEFIIRDIEEQDEEVRTLIETKIYKIVGEIYDRFHINSERFDRVEDYTKQVAIIPCSAITKIGIPELLMVITGLAQKYLENQLKIEVECFGKGTILEVKETKGLGTTIDVILYDGCIKVNDFIVIGGVDKPIVTKVRALLEPAPLSEMRDVKSRFIRVKEVSAATGVKIAAPGLENTVAGMPLKVSTEERLEEDKEEIMRIVKETKISVEKEGIIIKADTIGGLEALHKLLKEKNIPIRKAEIGPITKKDIVDAEAIYEKNPFYAVILGFNIPAEQSIEKVKIITAPIIYQIIEEFEKWQCELKEALASKEIENLVRPCKLELLPNCVFRQSNPAIIGVEVIAGVLKPNAPLMNKAGEAIAVVKTIQREKENVQKVVRGEQVAISLPGIIVDRHLCEEHFLLSDIPENDFRKLKELKRFLCGEEIELLKEIAAIKREKKPLWGV